MAFSQGMVSGTEVPVEHLDYDYIGKCKKAAEVEELLKILRSNKEGYYPDLIKFTEQHLLKLNPESKLLLKTEPAKKLNQLSSGESKEIAAELEHWESQINKEETYLQAPPTTNEGGGALINEDSLPPIRKSGAIGKPDSKGGGPHPSSTSSTSSGSKKETIKSSDHLGWETYNVEKECAKIDEEKGQEGAVRASVSIETELSKKELGLSAMEKEKLGLREKEKGNEAFKSGDYEEALSYYTRSVLLGGLVPTYNNRAITLIKLKRYKEALGDCDRVLQMEPTNTKALLRRGMAHVSLEDNWKYVERDMETILKHEPNNKKAQEMLTQAHKKISEGGGIKNKGRRVQIEEVDEENDKSANDFNSQPAPPMAPPTSPPVAAPIVPPPMPPAVLKLKERGNDLFRRGQYGEAVSQYTRAIQKLQGVEDHISSLSVLLNNRAACHLKNGHSRGCIEDCTKSIQLVPSNIKALVRRAQAYEHSEKYKLAYIDNQLALSLDRSMDAVYAANTRIGKILTEREGFNWRSQLPTHPDQSRVKPAPAESALPSQQNHVPPGNENELKKESGGTNSNGTSSPSPSPSPSPSTPPPITTTTPTPTHLQTKVTQATPPIPATISPSPPAPSPALPRELSNLERFENAKAKGNDYVKKGQYLEALNCYSLCISTCPQNIVGYTNRALCHIKLASPSSAESDCNKALEIDPHNIKALYRRARSRRDLHKYSESMKDLKLLLEVEPDNSVAQGEMAEVRKLWEKELRKLQETNQQRQRVTKDKAPPPSHKATPPSRGSKSTNKKKMKNKGSGEKKKEKSQNDQQRELEQLLEETKRKMNQLKKEVKDPLSFAEDFMKPSKTTYHTQPRPPPSTQPGDPPTHIPSAPRRRKVVVEEEKELTAPPPTSKTPPPTAKAPPPTTKAPPPKQLTPYEFIQCWNGIARGASPTGASGEYGVLLEGIPPDQLPNLITNKLEGPMLTDIISAITTYFIPQEKYRFCADILVNLAKVPRFQTILMFLEKQEKTALVRILAVLKDSGTVSNSTIASLRKDYSIKDT